MKQKIYICTIGPFSISEGFGIVDLLYSEEYISVSCVESKDDKWFVEILSIRPINENQLRRQLSDYKYSIKFGELKDIDWLEKCFENFKPIVIGSFYMFGPHLRAKQRPANKIGIEVAAATAFGTGEHPTTNRCLLACETFFDYKIHKRVLDLGCGSGILSIALAKLGCRNVLACDNDPEAVRITTENIEINHVAHDVSVYQNTAHEFDHDKYDFITANILSRPLVELSGVLYNCLAKNGFLVLSGFNSGDDIVPSKYLDLGLEQRARYDYNDWATIVLQK